MSENRDLALARERIGGVFRYLSELHRVRTPAIVRLDEHAWTLPLSTLPRSAFVKHGFGLGDHGEPVGDAPAEFVLKVGRPREPECPEPSVVLKNWFKAGWNRVDAEPNSFVKKTLKKNGRRLAFEDAEERVDALEAWLETKRTWEVEARHDAQGLAVFQNLFDLRARFQRESEKYQLFLADGILTFDHEDGEVSHPLLLQRVELRFDASIPEFTLAESDDNPEVYTPLLRQLGIDGRGIQSVHEEVAQEHYHPLAGDKTSAFLKDLVQRLWPDGHFLEDPRDVERTAGPRIHRAPHLFLGNRAQGLSENLERYIQSLPQQTEFPESLLRVVGIETERAKNGERPSEVLLTKPANREQEQVIQRLEETGAVLVQGPPGTGKSHTIANLVGHLLAQDKSILVTSHASKALRVVREKMAEPLQPLCVSLLQTDEEGSRQLEESITGIVNTLASTTQKKIGREIEKLETKRETLKARHAELSKSLLKAVKGEYEPIEVLGESIAPTDAARLIAEGTGSCDWIPGPLEAAELSLSCEEISNAYALSASLASEDQALLEVPLPDPSGFPSAREFASLHDDLAELERSRPDEGKELWRHDDQSADELADFFQEAKVAVQILDREQPWLTDCIEAGRKGGKRRDAWTVLAQQVEDCAREIPEREELVLAHDPEIDGQHNGSEVATTARAIADHLEAGKKLGSLVRFSKPRWAELLRCSRVGGETPNEAAHFRALESLVVIASLRADLSRRWDRQMTERGGPSAEELGGRPEERASSYAAQIREALAWHDERWAPCVARAQEIGLDFDRLSRETTTAVGASESTRLRDVVRTALEPVLEQRQRFIEWRTRRDRKAGWLLQLEEYSRRDAIYPVIKRMKSGIKKADYDAYAGARERIEELVDRQADHKRLGELLDRLATSAPALAEAMRSRRAPHDLASPPGDPAAAWRFRVCEQQLSGLSKLDPDKLQERLDRTRDELLAVTATYVEKLAWRAQLRRTGLEQQQALTGWLGLHKKMGKGTGKNVARLKEEAKKSLVACRSAVPVWIMPLSSVVDSFDLATTRFDVVILDEASQSDVLGLAAFALGKEVVVVGDHEQVSPYGVGQRGDRIQALIDEIPAGVPNRQLYDGKTSVYDLARQAFGGTIRLLEHFRCVPDIIQFSNDLCYRGEIRALREATSSPISPHLVAHRVAGEADANGINEREALEIASLVSALCRLEEYENSSVGVICMVGTDQALYIDSVLRRRLSVTEYQRRQILCGNASQFQGDERDVIFLSMVNSPSEKGALALRQREDARKMINVAASRARDQLWVVHSLDPGRDLKAGDLRLRLIAHAENPAALRPKRSDDERVAHASELEKRVHVHLSEAGYRLLKRYPVGEYVLDLVVEGASGVRAAIQCDGDRPFDESALAEAMDRQITLERLGWEFLRVRASEFYRAPERTLKKLERRLAALELRPLPDSAADSTQTEPAGRSEPLDAKVRKRAEQIRARWKDVPTVSSVLGTDASSSENQGLEPDAGDGDSE
jgi:very-short-patch-repair endonuclease